MFRICLILLFVLLCSARDLPSYLPRCYRDDPNLSKCMLKAFNDLRDRARSGIKEIGLPSMKKVSVPLVLNQETPLANYSVTTSDFTVKGLDNYNFTEFEYDPETMIARGQIEFPPLPISTHCNFSGQVLPITIRGTGFIDTTFGPMHASFEIKGQRKQIQGVDYYDAKDIHLDLVVDDGTYIFEGFFDNNEQLNVLATTMLNANSKLVAQAIGPALREIGEAGLSRFIRSFTKLIPYDKIFPRSP